MKREDRRACPPHPFDGGALETRARDADAAGKTTRTCRGSLGRFREANKGITLASRISAPGMARTIFLSGGVVNKSLNRLRENSSPRPAGSLSPRPGTRMLVHHLLKLLSEIITV